MSSQHTVTTRTLNTVYIYFVEKFINEFKNCYQPRTNFINDLN